LLFTPIKRANVFAVALRMAVLHPPVMAAASSAQ
jgi:hypothetical protein